MHPHAPQPAPARCPRCLLRWEDCLCADVVPVPTRTHFLLLRHIKEACKSSNTGRLAHLALPSSALVDWGAPGQPLDEAPLREPGTWVLFPEGQPLSALPEPPRRLVVLDGSWPQARRMLHRIRALQTMPRVTLPPPEVAPLRLRRPPHPDGMSTIEAVAQAVEVLEGPERAAPLRALFATLVRRVLVSRGTWPGGGAAP